MLTLIGTSHLDLEGFKRLRIILQKIKPSLIGNETTNSDYKETLFLIKSLSDKKKFSRALRNAKKQFSYANPKTLRLWLSSVSYEDLAISEYAALNHIEVLYCDSPQELARVDFEGESARQEIARNLEDFLKLTPEQARLDIQREYSLRKYPVRDNLLLARFYKKRDKFAEHILRRQKGNIVYVCGLDHLFGDYHPNLFERLTDLNPKRMKLNKADLL